MTTIYQKREFKWLVVISSALALQAGFINAITFSGNFSVGNLLLHLKKTGKKIRSKCFYQALRM
jgi:hypothetical protein